MDIVNQYNDELYEIMGEYKFREKLGDALMFDSSRYGRVGTKLHSDYLEFYHLVDGVDIRELLYFHSDGEVKSKIERVVITPYTNGNLVERTNIINYIDGSSDMDVKRDIVLDNASIMGMLEGDYVSEKSVMYYFKRSPYNEEEGKWRVTYVVNYEYFYVFHEDYNYCPNLSSIYKKLITGNTKLNELNEDVCNDMLDDSKLLGKVRARKQ